jgi:hypothetical protein
MAHRVAHWKNSEIYFVVLQPDASLLDVALCLHWPRRAEGVQQHQVTICKMNYFAAPTPLNLRTGFDPDECGRRLGETIDPEQPTMFGFSGFQGSKPFLGMVDGRRFRLLQRVSSGRNTFPLVLTGEFEPLQTGARVRATFDLDANSKIAVSILAFVGLLVLVPIVLGSRESHPLLSAVFTVSYLSLLLFAPRILRGITIDQENHIARFLEDVLVADDDASSATTPLTPE